MQDIVRVFDFRGVRYKGGWKRGLRHGYGELIYKDGSSYKGSWQNGKKHGLGTLVYSSGNVYEGGWKHDRKSGKGVMLWNTRNERYEGEWEDDLPNGYGCHVWFYKVRACTPESQNRAITELIGMESSPEFPKKAKTRAATPSSSKKNTSQFTGPKKRTASLRPQI